MIGPAPGARRVVVRAGSSSSTSVLGIPRFQKRIHVALLLIYIYIYIYIYINIYTVLAPLVLKR